MRSVGRDQSVGKSESISRKAVSKKRIKECIPVARNFVMSEKEGSRGLNKYRKMG